jgi:ATP-dependent DNA helicase RecG
LKALVSCGESYNLEFKESYSDSIGKEICAFANSKGGKILLGVTDKGELKGVTSSNTLKSRIYDLSRNFDPPLQVDVEEVENIIIIHVDEGVIKPYSVKGRFYIRYGANSQQLKRDEIKEFFKEENLIGFDDKINKEFNLETDLENAKLDYFIEKARVSPVIKNEKILGNLGVVKDGYIKNAGVLMFCRDVTKFFLNATVSCFLYMGTEKYKILDKKEFGNDIFSNYENSIKYLMTHLNTEYIIKGGPREEKLELPEEALREAVLNAVAHRDYYSRANIHVNIFKDRVEIVNPGGLIGNLSVEDLYEKSIPRNSLLFYLMEKMELVEKAGSGLVRIEKAMQEYKLEKPVIKADRNWFHIAFKRPVLQEAPYEERMKRRSTTKAESQQKHAPKTAPINAPIKLTAFQQELLDELKHNATATYDVLAERFDKDRTTVKRNIRKLKEKNFLRRIGSKKSGHWDVISNS